MNYDVIINLIDEHNESGILLTEKYCPKEVIFLYFNEEELNYLYALKEYYNKRFKFCTFFSKKLNMNGYEEVDLLLKEYKNKKVLLNLTAGKKLESLILYTVCMKNNIECKYIDIEKELLISFNNDKLLMKKQSFIDLDVEDVIKSIGGSIIIDSTEVCNLNIIEELTLAI
ncbi:MAG: Card1-like endonuclease domain-containing protein, partial [Sarcina sp.]